jgi:hypothetical protein
MVSPGFVKNLLLEHDRGRRDNHHHLWKLLMLELWFQEDARVRTNIPSAEACAV